VSNGGTGFYFHFMANVPAVVMIGMWILTQIVSISLIGEQDGGVAYWVHVGGFAVGLALTLVFRSSQGVATPSPYYRRR